MKKTLLRIAAFAACILPVISCQEKNGPVSSEDPYINIVSGGKIEASYEEKVFEVKVESNCAWTIAKTDEEGTAVDWVKCAGSTGKGNMTLEVKVFENKTANPRSATVTLAQGDVKAFIDITQAANPNPEEKPDDPNPPTPPAGDDLSLFFDFTGAPLDGWPTAKGSTHVEGGTQCIYPLDGTDYTASGKRAVKIIGDNGKLDLTVKNGSSRVFTADKTEFTVKVSATGYPDLEFKVTKESEVSFVTMNIPYNVFYSSDVKNDVDVDAVTSATTSKWTTFGGTYFTEANENGGGQILGVSFPVEVSKEDYAKLKNADSKNDDYYFTELAETPSVYKTLTVDSEGKYSFSAVKGTVTDVDNVEYTLSANSKYGDYQIDISNTTIDGTVYGIIVTTDDGTQYGLRHLENIWKKSFQFAWSSGIKTTESHGNTLAPEHYKSIMGDTIKEITYITDKGITNYTVDAYVPVKAASVVTVADAKADDTSTKVTVKPELPEDYNAEYAVSGLDTSYADGTLSFKNAKAGSYTLTVSDKDGKYADLSTTFVLSTDKAAAKYDSKNTALVEDNASDEDFKVYLTSLTSVKVDDTSYSAAGHGAVTIIDPETGKIDLEAKSRNNPVFDTENKDTFNITVTAAGYPELTFTISTKEEPKTAFLGDVTGDGKIDSEDSLYILRASVNLEKLSDEQTKLADINNDGKVLSDDALAVLRYSVKLTDDSNKNVGSEINVD